jgi:pyruvate formate lyase activating enzyme
MRDTAEAAKQYNVKSVVVTGGFIASEPLAELCGLVDAIKVDLKAFSDRYYRELVNGELKPVLDALVEIRKRGVWLEIVYLVIPTLNDGDKELKVLASWVKSELGTEVPIHFSRFHPMYLLKNLPPTPVRTLEKAKAICDAEGLNYVYIGNVSGHPAEDTYCPGCGETLIERSGYRISQPGLKEGSCSACGRLVPGVWD